MRGLAGQIEQRLSTDLGFRISKHAPIEPAQAHNNRLLHVWSVDGREVVVKVYFPDDRCRLDREFSAITYLRGRGVAAVPAPYLRDDEYGFAVYSFEPGVTRLGPDLTLQHVETVAEFAARLHHIHPDEPGAKFRTSVPATFSFTDQVLGIRRRLALFTDFTLSPAVPMQVRELCREVDVTGEMEQMISIALTDADDRRVTRENWGLSTGDLAPHNVLVGEGGSIRVLDLEYSGWDDPLIPCADFLSAESSIGLSPACIATFLQTYRRLARLTPAEVYRLRRVRALMEIGWVAVHLSLFLPERIAPKRFADPEFDVDAHLTERVQRVRARLARAREVLPWVLGLSGSLK